MGRTRHAAFGLFQNTFLVDCSNRQPGSASLHFLLHVEFAALPFEGGGRVAPEEHSFVGEGLSQP